MPLPARKHLPLDEVAEGWETTVRHLIEYGAEDQIAIAVRLFGAQAELCCDVEEQSTGLRREVLWGAKSLFAEDLWRLHGHGMVRLVRVKADQVGSYYALFDSQFDISLADLVITMEEKNRFETAHGLTSAVETEHLFAHDAAYRSIKISGCQFSLSPKRADIVRILHEAWRTGMPWMSTEALMQAAGSESSRVVDVFGPLKGWRTILCSDNAGNWRINLPDPVPDAKPRRAYRRPWLRLVR